MSHVAIRSGQERHIERILRQIDSLPMLPSVATRLLSLTADDESHLNEIVELVSSDPALTGKVLALCRRADMAVREEVLEIDRAIVLLGFNTIRNAVLSVKVLEVFKNRDVERQSQLETSFNHTDFWRHCLATATAAELIARAHPDQKDIPASEAFVCGLLHDIGKLALYMVLPKSYDRVIELADLNQGNIAEFERRVLGVDHHTAGKRLAEQWQLPRQIIDCLWLHGTPYEHLPKLGHRRMVGLVGLADLLVRRSHLGYSGNYVLHDEPGDVARTMGFDPDAIDSVAQKLHEQLQRRAAALGLDDQLTQQLYVASLQSANQELGRLNNALDRRSRMATQQQKVLESIMAFHAGTIPGRDVEHLLDAVADSAASIMGRSFYALLYEDHHDDEEKAWLVCQYHQDGKPIDKQWITLPDEAPAMTGFDFKQSTPDVQASILPWLRGCLTQAQDADQLCVLPLSCGWGTVALLLHDPPKLAKCLPTESLCNTWGTAIAVARQHQGARWLGERLVESNRVLAQTQDSLLEAESMTRLGEMAAGTAHEMNNPLAVISGRSQLLAASLSVDSEERVAAQTIVEQVHRLSDLIASLLLYAEPPLAHRRAVSVGALLQGTVDRVRRDLGESKKIPPFYVKVQQDLEPVSIDPELVGLALTELLKNAAQSSRVQSIQLSARLNQKQNQLLIEVADDGAGMDDHTLSHAVDPFFSARLAGRGVGMGLCRAKQWAAAHHGTLELRSTQGRGALARLKLSLNNTN